MEPNRFGRKLGIGVRVAARMAKERAAQAGTPPPPGTAPAAGGAAAPASRPETTAPPPPQAASQSQAASQPRPTSRPQGAKPAAPKPKKDYAEPARRVGIGTRRFGKAVAGPVLHLSGTLWLEITGLFFALFAAFFGQNAWKTRASAAHGPEHAHFLIYVTVTVIFAYFCVSSFLKARRRSRQS